MAEESQQDHRATRRGVLLGVGLVGVGGVLAGCSTAPVPYEANEAGIPPGEEAPTPSAIAVGTAAGGVGDAAASSGGTVTGTLLGLATQVPVGGGTVFTDAKVVVTQPVEGEFKAFSAICTHVGCLCNQVADGTIDCPCHGSKFKITNGAVVTGPAASPLPARTITIADGKIILE